ncbi:MAG: hypothetical protein H0X38_11410 [Planctomycetes bacterium]|nr:hypothetical protein [Planctomycetota bacterium]
MLRTGFSCFVGNPIASTYLPTTSNELSAASPATGSCRLSAEPGAAHRVFLFHGQSHCFDVPADDVQRAVSRQPSNWRLAAVGCRPNPVLRTGFSSFVGNPIASTHLATTSNEPSAVSRQPLNEKTPAKPGFFR